MIPNWKISQQLDICTCDMFFSDRVPLSSPSWPQTINLLFGHLLNVNVKDMLYFKIYIKLLNEF